MAANKISIAVIGAGNVGRFFVSQLDALSSQLSSPKLNLCYLATSKRALYDPNYQPIVIADALDKLPKSSQIPLLLPELLEYLAAAPSKVVLVDNSSSQEMADSYPAVIRRGITVVTPNKKAFSGPPDLWHNIIAAKATSGAGVFHESSVGAGLPVISTLKDLVETGDTVTKIEGIFSGTMSFLLNSFSPAHGEGDKWSVVVGKARELGYTEPDPRDDLNGMDVARKLTILARLVGLEVDSPTSFPVQSLIPSELEACVSSDEFLSKLSEFDDRMDNFLLEAKRKHQVLRYVGSIDVKSRHIKVGLEFFDISHPFAALRGSDNIIGFHTVRYGLNPLIIQGAGAGGEVTAMGVTSDLLKAIARLQ